MKNRFLWFLFFSVCLGVGFLHGILPRSISKRNIISPTKIEILATDEIFLPEQTRRQIEQEFNVKLSYTVTRNWDSIIAQLVASPGVDLIFLPSYWAKALAQQGLLSDISGTRKSLQKKVASDFIDSGLQTEFNFLPFFWMKSEIRTSQNESFPDFLKNKKEPVLFLLADEDLLLKHFQTWKKQNLWSLISQKKILTLQLDQLNQNLPSQGAFEAALESSEKEKGQETKVPPYLSALLTWGAAIPATSPNKILVLDILDALTTAEAQERTLLQTPFNTTFSAVTSDKIPLHRRASFIRDIQLKDVLILEKKDQNAKIKLKDEFNFTL